MKLQKLKHCYDDLMGFDTNGCVFTHVVNEIVLGGEFTVCGRAIPDAALEREGWEAVGEEFKGTIEQCSCPNCKRVIQYFKELK